MIVLDYHDRRPIYEQVTERFRQLILEWGADSRKPSSIRAAACYGIVH